MTQNERNGKRADKLFERAGKLKGFCNDRGFWLCSVFGFMKTSMEKLHLDLMEEELDKMERSK